MAIGQSTGVTHEVEYRSIPGLSAYRVGSDASVWSLRNGIWFRLAPQVKKDTGHLRVQLRRAGKRWNVGVHHLLLMTFGSPRPSVRHECRHLDGDPTNNVLSNLAWGTKKQNADDRRRHGRNPVGVRHGQAKIDEDDVLLLRQLRARGWTQDALAMRFGISRRGVRLILAGANWSHVTEVAA